MMRRFWPELVVLGLGLWFGAIFGLTDDKIMAYRLTGDSLLSPFFYDHVSRGMLGQVDFEWLQELNYPKPKHYTIEFPNVADAIFFSPIHWLFEWPQQWNVTFHSYILLNGLSMALLARVLGLGPFGILMAGLCGLWMRAPYVDMAKGRIQTVGLAFFVTALATTLGFLSQDLQGRVRSLRTRQIFWLSSVISSALAALIYPPFLLLLLPFGVLLWFAHTPNRDDFKWLGAAVGLVSLLTAWPLFRMAEIRQFHGQQLQCPTDFNRLQLSGLWTTTAELVHHGVPLALWGGLGLWCFWRGRAKLWLGIVAVSLVYLGLSLGPCIGGMDSEPILPGFHRWLMWIQDWGRLSTVAVIGLSLLLSASFGALMSRNRRWGIGGLVLALGLCFPLMQDLQNPQYWHPIRETFYQRHLKGLDSQKVVVFPFESSQTILDALALPQHQMVNPLRSQDPPQPEHNTAVRWLFELGKGNPNPTTIAAGSLEGLMLDWVIYDPSRCATEYRYQEACAGHVQRALKAELGNGVAAEDGVVLWEIE